jgi:transglutaminase-like putative cysteine protease
MVSVVTWLVFVLLHRYRKNVKDIIQSVIVLYMIALIGHYSGYHFNQTIALFLKNLFNVLSGDRIVDVISQVVRFYSNQLDEVPLWLSRQVFVGVSVIITYLVMKLLHRKSIRTLMLIPPLFFLVQWARYVDISFVAVRWYMIGFIGYLMYVLSQVNWSSNKSHYNRFTERDYFVYSLTIATAVMLLTSLLFAIYPLKKINEQFSGIMPTFSSMRTGYTSRSDQYVYFFNNSMYMPNEDRLGGRITERNYDEIMLVKSEYGGQYLRGSVKDYYSGYNWSKTETSYRNRVNYEIKEVPFSDLTIYPTNIQTATLFAPLSIRNIDLSINKVYVNKDEVYYYYRDSLEKRLSSYRMTVYDEPINHLMTGDLEPYLQLPQGISQRVMELSVQITEEDAIAAEKIRSIKDFLKENYPYTLFVNHVPREAEFVDYFLFEEKKGYCTYFASAVAVMARINGIPSRYVEGYLSEVEENNLGYYEVTGDRAHAWAEVYIGGVWQTVEATPHYLNELEVVEYEVDIVEGDNVEEFDRPEVNEELLEPEILLAVDYEVKTLNWIRYLVSGLLLLILAVVWIWIKKRKKKLTVGNRIVMLVNLIENDDTVLHHTRIPELLLKEYSMKVLGYKIPNENIQILQKLLYSTMGLNLEEKNTIIEEMTDLEKRMKEHHGRTHFYRLRWRVLK